MFDALRKAAQSFVAGPNEDCFFPDGRVRSNGLALSPVTGADMYGLPNVQLFQTGAYPETDDGRQYSMEQGIGRSPGQTWPHMPHREQYNFESLCNMTGIMEQGTADLPAESGANPLIPRFERAGWVLPGPAGGVSYYYGQYVSEHEVKPDPISTEMPSTVPYTAIAEVPA